MDQETFSHISNAFSIYDQDHSDTLSLLESLNLPVEIKRPAWLRMCGFHSYAAYLFSLDYSSIKDFDLAIEDFGIKFNELRGEILMLGELPPPPPF